MLMDAKCCPAALQTQAVMEKPQTAPACQIGPGSQSHLEPPLTKWLQSLQTCRVAMALEEGSWIAFIAILHTVTIFEGDLRRDYRRWFSGFAILVIPSHTHAPPKRKPAL